MRLIDRVDSIREIEQRSFCVSQEYSADAGLVFSTKNMYVYFIDLQKDQVRALHWLHSVLNHFKAKSFLIIRRHLNWLDLKDVDDVSGIAQIRMESLPIEARDTNSSLRFENTELRELACVLHAACEFGFTISSDLYLFPSDKEYFLQVSHHGEVFAYFIHENEMLAFEKYSEALTKI